MRADDGASEPEVVAKQACVACARRGKGKGDSPEERKASAKVRSPVATPPFARETPKQSLLAGYARRKSTPCARAALGLRSHPITPYCPYSSSLSNACHASYSQTRVVLMRFDKSAWELYRPTEDAEGRDTNEK